MAINSPELNSLRFGQQGFARCLHLFHGDGQNTLWLLESIAAISGAGIAREIILHHAMRSLPGSPVNGTAGAENGYNWPSRSGGDMRGAAIVTYKNPRTGRERNQFAQIERIKQREFAAALPSQLGDNFRFSASRIKNRRDSVCVFQPAREACEFLRRPALGEIFPSRMNYGIRSAA